jgi:hypothetical protein
VSPILIRPLREQLEHDRIIRLLQAKWKRKHDVEVNLGDDRLASVKIGPMVLFPDLVITAHDTPRRLQGVVEVETGESVNNMEAMAQWAHFGKARAPFYLYVPVGAVEIARRLCTENRVTVTELWSYLAIGDQIRFTLVDKNAPPEMLPVRAEKPARKANGGAKVAPAKPAAARPVSKATAARTAKAAARPRVSGSRTATASRTAAHGKGKNGAQVRSTRATSASRSTSSRKGSRATKAPAARTSRTQSRTQKRK